MEFATRNKPVLAVNTEVEDATKNSFLDISTTTSEDLRCPAFHKSSILQQHFSECGSSKPAVSSTPSPASTVSPSPKTFQTQSLVPQQPPPRLPVQRQTTIFQQPKSVPAVVARSSAASFDATNTRNLASPLGRLSMNSPVSLVRSSFEPYIEADLGSKNAAEFCPLTQVSGPTDFMLPEETEDEGTGFCIPRRRKSKPDFHRSRSVDGLSEIENLTPALKNMDNEVHFQPGGIQNPMAIRRKRSFSTHALAPPQKIIAKYSSPAATGRDSLPSAFGSGSGADHSKLSTSTNFVVPSPREWKRGMQKMMAVDEMAETSEDSGRGKESDLLQPFELKIPPLIRATSPIMKKRSRGRAGGSRGGQTSSPLLNFRNLTESSDFNSKDHYSHPRNIDVCGLSSSEINASSAAGSPETGRETPIPDLDQNISLLPTEQSTDGCQLRKISVETVAKLLKGEFESVKKYIIIDCRFEYEYEGGHIRGAVNVVTPDKVIDMLFKNSICDKNTCILFHCEFSSHRAPKLMKAVRGIDRKIHQEEYPKLFYPQLYLIEGGYKRFWESYPTFCEPRNYIHMVDDNYSELCKSTSTMVRMSWRRHKSFDVDALRHSCPSALLDGSDSMEGPSEARRASSLSTEDHYIGNRKTSFSEGAYQ